jgi:hypothetical protein
MTTTRLLTLPPEIRLRVYEDVLSPGVLWLTRNATKRFAIEPRISPPILATCRQIHYEAKNLIYTDNEITFTIDAHDTFAPVINESRLPQHALEKLQHVCIIVDCTATIQASLEDVDFTSLEALVSLRTLRLGFVLYKSPYVVEHGYELGLQYLITQILTRIPATTKILTEFDGQAVQSEVMEKVRAERARARRESDCIFIVPAGKVDEAFKAIDSEIRGQRSGQTRDVFAEHRAHARSGGFAGRH